LGDEARRRKDRCQKIEGRPCHSVGLIINNLYVLLSHDGVSKY
jgi:hypothetical protein